MDDVFSIWPHDMSLDEFLEHLNSQHPAIQFTMEKENDRKRRRMTEREGE